MILYVTLPYGEYFRQRWQREGNATYSWMFPLRLWTFIVIYQRATILYCVNVVGQLLYYWYIAYIKYETRLAASTGSYLARKSVFSHFIYYNQCLEKIIILWRKTRAIKKRPLIYKGFEYIKFGISKKKPEKPYESMKIIYLYI